MNASTRNEIAALHGAEVVQEGLGQDAARGVVRAEEEDAQGFGTHEGNHFPGPP